MADPHFNGNGNGGVRWWNDRAGLLRHVIAIAGVLVIGGIGWARLDAKVDGNYSGLKDHSREIIAVKTDIVKLQIQLADGTSGAQIRTDTRLESVERYIQEQRATNATVTEQNRQTKDAVQEIEADVKGLRNEIGTLNGNVRSILNHLERRSPPPDFR